MDDEKSYSKLLLGLGESLVIGGINDENDTTDIREILLPQSSG